MYAEDNVVVFLRVWRQQHVLVSINRSDACEVVLEKTSLMAVNAWYNREGKIIIHDNILTLPAISATVWWGS